MYPSMEKCKHAETALIRVPCASVLAMSLSNKTNICASILTEVQKAWQKVFARLLKLWKTDYFCSVTNNSIKIHV